VGPADRVVHPAVAPAPGLGDDRPAASGHRAAVRVRRAVAGGSGSPVPRGVPMSEAPAIEDHRSGAATAVGPSRSPRSGGAPSIVPEMSAVAPLEGAPPIGADPHALLPPVSGLPATAPAAPARAASAPVPLRVIVIASVVVASRRPAAARLAGSNGRVDASAAAIDPDPGPSAGAPALAAGPPSPLRRLLGRVPANGPPSSRVKAIPSPVRPPRI
jgi:hypothetical protein